MLEPTTKHRLKLAHLIDLALIKETMDNVLRDRYPKQKR
ncbi:Uncharacterised protein [Streptococcus pneumoniae]|nr:Uncharacterised protein [Streptococcus pneumoniae]